MSAAPAQNEVDVNRPRRRRRPKHYDPRSWFLPVRRSARQYRNETARHIHNAAMRKKRGKTRRMLLKRAFRMRGCGTSMNTFRCGECKEVAPGLGELAVMPCRSRVCPPCDRVRSRRQAARLIRLMERVQQNRMPTKGLGPKFWTFTSKYDPTDWDQVSESALAERVDGLLGVIAKLWARVFKPRGAVAMFVRVELGFSGAVHAHAILIGTYVPKELVESYGIKLWAGFGHSWVETARVDSKNGIAREVAKYSVKSPGTMSEGWLAGEQRVCMDPLLAATWELATMRKHLQRTYGEFRGAVPDDDDDEDTAEEQDERTTFAAQLECPSCGTRGSWKPIIIDTEQGIRALHARRLKALWKSRWEPDIDDW